MVTRLPGWGPMLLTVRAGLGDRRRIDLREGCTFTIPIRFAPTANPPRPQTFSPEKPLRYPSPRKCLPAGIVDRKEVSLVPAGQALSLTRHRFTKNPG